MVVGIGVDQFKKRLNDVTYNNSWNNMSISEKLLNKSIADINPDVYIIDKEADDYYNDETTCRNEEWHEYSQSLWQVGRKGVKRIARKLIHFRDRNHRKWSSVKVTFSKGVFISK